MEEEHYEGIPLLRINLLTLSSETYDEIMNRIAAVFANRAEYSFRGVPVTTNAPGWLIISLDMPNSPSVLLLINLKNGYLTAFGDGEGQWYRFSDLHDPLPFDSEVIKHLESNYRSLARAEVAVGSQAARDAYFALLNFNNNLPLDNPGVDVYRRALARLATMFCEAARFRTVRTLTSLYMGLFINAIIDHITKKKIRSWSLMSGFALHCWRREQDNIEGFDELELAKVDACGIHSIEDITGELLLILYRP